MAYSERRTVVFDIGGVIACAPASKNREAEVVMKVRRRFGEKSVNHNT